MTTNRNGAFDQMEVLSIEQHFEQLNQKIMQYSTMVDSKVSIIEEVCQQLFRIEEGQDEIKMQINELIEIQSEEIRELRSASQNLERVVKRDIELFRYQIKKKLGEYEQFKMQMDYMLEQASLLVESRESPVPSMSKKSSNRGVMSSGKMTADDVELDMDQLMTDACGELDRLKEENERLMNLSIEQKKIIDELFEDRKAVMEYSEQEIEKWKQLSLLSVPLIQLLDISMQRQQIMKVDQETQVDMSNVEEKFQEELELSLDEIEIMIIESVLDYRPDGVQEQIEETTSRLDAELTSESDLAVSVNIRENPEIHHIGSKENETPIEEPVEEDSDTHSLRSVETVRSDTSMTPSVDFYNEYGHPIPHPNSSTVEQTPMLTKCETRRRTIGSRDKDHLDGFSKRACFDSPMSLHPWQNYLYVAEMGNRAIRKVNLCDGLVSTVTNPIDPEIPFRCPSGICASEDGSVLYVADVFSHLICEVDVASGYVKTAFPKLWQQIGRIKYPSHIIVQDGMMYISYDHGIIQLPSSVIHSSHRVKNQSSVAVTFIGNTKKKGYKDGSFDECLFDHPNGMVFLSPGMLLVCDSRNNVLRIVDFERRMVETFGGNGKCAVVDESLFECSFCHPRKVCYNKERNLVFLTESTHGNIRVIDPTSETVHTLRIPNAPSVSSPYDVALFRTTVDSEEELFIVDTLSHCIEGVSLLQLLNGNPPNYASCT